MYNVLSSVTPSSDLLTPFAVATLPRSTSATFTRPFDVRTIEGANGVGFWKGIPPSPEFFSIFELKKVSFAAYWVYYFLQLINLN